MTKIKSFAKRTVFRMTKIKGTKEHGLLQMTICMIRPPLCSSVPLQMVICKEDGSLDDQNQGGGRAGIVANDHPEDPASSVSLQMVVCKEDCPSDDQNQRDGVARIVANDHLDDPASSVPLQMVICKEDCPPNDQNQRDGGARIVKNDHLYYPAYFVLLLSFAKGHLQRDRSSG